MPVNVPKDGHIKGDRNARKQSVVKNLGHARKPGGKGGLWGDNRFKGGGENQISFNMNVS